MVTKTYFCVCFICCIASKCERTVKRNGHAFMLFDIYRFYTLFISFILHWVCCLMYALTSIVVVYFMLKCSYIDTHSSFLASYRRIRWFFIFQAKTYKSTKVQQKIERERETETHKENTEIILILQFKRLACEQTSVLFSRF